jgi:RHS repeat-associated protein
VLFVYSQASAQIAEFTQNTGGSNTMSLEVPIAGYPGRGASLPITLHYSSRGLWRINYLGQVKNIGQVPQSVAEAIFAEHSSAGWTTSLDVPEIEWPKDNDVYWYTGRPYTKGYLPTYTFRIARVFVHMPDGSTHELRKADALYQNSQVSMTGTFYAVDGSRLRYDRASDGTATLFLGDGTRYRYNGGQIQYLDRNGNTLNYSVADRQWTDTMDRHIQMPWPANPGAGDYPYYLPGYSQPFIFKFRNLASAPIGNYYLPSPGSPLTNQSGGNFPQPTGTSALFTSEYATEGEETSLTYVVGRGQAGANGFDAAVLTEIDLPNGQQYLFSYNTYGELDKVTYPTGAYQRYQYGVVPTLGGASVPYQQATRGITSRWVSANGLGNDEAQWLYSATVDPFVITAPDETGQPNGIRTEIYLFNAPVVQANNFGYMDARNGTAVDERIYAPAAAGGAMLRRSVTEFTQSSVNINKPQPPGTINPGFYTAFRNARPTKTVSMLLDTGGDALAKTVTYEYASGYEYTTGLDRTASNESYFASVPPGTALTGPIESIQVGYLASRAETTYLNDPAYVVTRNILGRPTSIVLMDGNYQPVSKSESFYDEAGLLDYADLPGDYWEDPGSIRGNVTTVRRYLDPSASVPAGQACPAAVCLESHAYFDLAGNMWKSKNERGVETQTDFPSGYKHAFAASASTAAPDPSGTHGSNAGFTSTSTFDFTTGLTLTTTDANGQTTTFSYSDDANVPDPLHRLRKVTRPDGGWTRYSFGEAPGNLYTMTEAKYDATRIVKSYQYADASGRGTRSFSSEGGDSYIAADTIYDRLGRVWKVSNPYRTTTIDGVPSLAHTGDWTVSHYDIMSRIDYVTLSDASLVQTAYQGIYTTVTDQAGRQRRQKTDALGRIVRVDEPGANGSLGSDFDHPAQPTSYQYNTQGNLITISQGVINPNDNLENPANYTQHRYFKYDSLGRLTHERQVEQVGTITLNDPLTGNNNWSRKLVYDEPLNGANYTGLLTSSYDARNIETQFHYDNLNRIYQVNYSDGTPTVTNYYDQASSGYFNKGHLTQASTAAVGPVPATSQSYNFDLMGRVANNQQSVADQSYAMSYSYNLGGAMTSQQYPSGRVISYAFDDAARLSQVSSGSKVYANQFDYTSPQGLLKSVRLGNGSVESYDYNSRLQMKSLDLTKSGTQLQHYDYKYGVYDPNSNIVDESKNNGQIARIEGLIGTAKQWQQNFAYDSLGRLSSAREFRGDNNQQSWLVNYNYDVFGNRYQYQSQNGNNLFDPKWVEAGQIDQTTNRFNSGVTYDDAGNITVDSKFRNLQFQYDANNRQKESKRLDNSGAVVSVCDAGGQRVATQVNNTLTNILVYDAGGKLVAEYGPPAGGGTQYLFSDQQGSPRVIASSSGAVVSRHDYAPFGEEIGAVGMRTSGQGYGAVDSARQKYAGMETDDATGMDHTLWRQYDSSSGRWTAPDPYGGSMSATSPQTFNRYTYVNNDPVNKVDPIGLMLSDIGVFQTNDPEEAATVQRKSDADWKKAINKEYAARHGGTVEYDNEGHASFTSNGAPETFGVTVTAETGNPWDPEDHDKILADAIGGFVSLKDLFDAQDGSRDIDLGLLHFTLNPAEAYLHAMVPEQWIKKYGPQAAMQMAIDKAAEFTRRQLAEAQRLMKRANMSGFKDESAAFRRQAFREFGAAMHPIMDALSPTHQFQAYGVPLNPIRFLRELGAHSAGEARGPNASEMSIMRDQIRMFYRRTF